MEKQKGKNAISLGEHSAPTRPENLPCHAYFLAEKGRYLNSESWLNPIPSGVLAALKGANRRATASAAYPAAVGGQILPGNISIKDTAHPH